MKYKINVAIQSDKLNQAHAAGDIADLTGWPAEVISRWLERGVIEEHKTDGDKPTRQVRKNLG